MSVPKRIDAIPGDKSISHRAIIIGALAHGVSRFHGFLCSDDCLNTLAIFRQLGVRIDHDGTHVTVHGAGVSALKSPESTLNVGNSGTGIRLIAGALAGSSVTATLTGDASIQQRPMGRIATPLTAMGGHIELCNDQPPIHVIGNSKLTPHFHYDMPVASAQVKSAILLAACASNIPVKITEPEACRDHTERLLAHFGAVIDTTGGTISMTESTLVAPEIPIQIPGDISSALFFICCGLMCGTPVVLTSIGLNPSRIGCLAALKMMGADVHVVPNSTSYEPMGDIHVSPSSNQKNTDIPIQMVPNIIDELPILSMLALTQPGVFRVRGAEELRVKESDRISGIIRLVRALGGDCQEYDDGFDIVGRSVQPKNIHFDAHFDHRLAMSAKIAMAAFKINGSVDGADSIATSFPNFSEKLNQFLLK
jgi:3-phosphoshikimate 1-carboxyvinyltransferase